MATYPTFPLAKGSKRIPRDGREELVMGDGSTQVSKVHADKFDFLLVHNLTTADAATLQAFYDANAIAESIDYVFPVDGVTYQVRFGKDGHDPAWASPGRRDVRVRLVGV